MSKLGKGYIHIYTGNGKGKTTAAIGQAVRAAGSNLKSFIMMFMKDFPYGEVRALEKLKDWITIDRFGKDDFVYKKQKPPQREIEIAQKALKRAYEMMMSGKYDIIILDEICVTVYFGLLRADEVLPVLVNKPEGVELILTGRYCPEEWLEKANLVTEMKEIKHYYEQKITARKGIES